MANSGSMSHVQVANDNIITAIEQGSAYISKYLILENAIYVLDCASNLIYIK